MNLPKHKLLVHRNVLVELVADRGLLKRTEASAEHEKDHSESEHIGHDWLIDAAESDFRCHVVDRANFVANGTHAILFAARERARHSEVNYPQVEVRVEHQILQFQVPVAHSRLVHLPNRRDQLVHVVLNDGQGQFACHLDRIKKVSIRCKLVRNTTSLSNLHTNVLLHQEALDWPDCELVWHEQHAAELVSDALAKQLGVLENFQCNLLAVFLG